MTRINLFPNQRAAELRRQRRLRIEMQVGVGAVAVGFAVCAILLIMFDRAINETNEDIQTQEANLRFLENRVREVKQFEIHRTNLEHYRQAMQQRLSQQGRTIRLLDTISRTLDPLALWLTRLQIDGQFVYLEGAAFSRRAIIRLTKQIEQTPFSQSIKILETRIERNAKRIIYVFAITVHLQNSSYNTPTPI